MVDQNKADRIYNMNKKLVLFSHHYVDDIVIERFNNLKNLNPTWDIIPIGFEGYNLLDGSIILNNDKFPSNQELVYFAPKYHVNWFEPDLFIYESYYQRPDYDEYFLYEYDTICNVSIEEFFNTNVDFFGNTICNPGDETWDWVKLYRKHNLYNTRFKKIYSYGQSTCIYFKKEILKQCVEEVIKNKHFYDNMLSEIRAGTLVNQFTTLKKGREDINNFISWTTNDINLNLNQSYFYHPVK